MKTIAQLAAFLLFTFMLASCNDSKKMASTSSNMEGEWTLNYIAQAPKPVPDLYPDVKPSISFMTNENRAGGKTGCNSYSLTYTSKSGAIDFTAPMAVTKMLCINSTEGENLFLKLLPEVKKSAVVGGELLFSDAANLLLMKFERKM